MNNIFVLFDFETTGLDPFKNNRIVQIGAILLRAKNKNNVSFDKIVNPKIPVSKYSVASKIHKISTNRLRNAKSFKYIFKEFADWLCSIKKNDENIILCGHNSFDFDNNFLVVEMLRYNLEEYIPFDIFLSDSLHIFRSWFPNEKSHSLPILYKNILNKELIGAHNALTDVNAMRKIMCKYNKIQTQHNQDYNIEKNMIELCNLKNIKDEIIRIKQKIIKENINLLPEIFYIRSDKYNKHIIKKDGGRWDDINRAYYYNSKQMYDNAIENVRIIF